MYDIDMISSLQAKYDVVIVAVKHEIFKKIRYKDLRLIQKKYILFDLKILTQI